LKEPFVQGVHLFELASQKAHWLAVRQAAVAENVANADTPGYKMRDVAPFEEALTRAGLTMAATHPGHMGNAASPAARIAIVSGESWEATPSGNNVALEQELIKGDEILREYSLNTSIVQAFHRMWMASVKG
jgi:flagellar basal-body rod protein FlgB